MGHRPSRKSIKIGVHLGGGPPPGYRWQVLVLDQAYDEANDFLSPDQYEHMARQIRDLAGEVDPSHSETVDVRAFADEGFYEVRDKGGILTRINVRIFFLLDRDPPSIVVLGAIKKENNGPTPTGDRLTMRRRKRLYLDAKSA